MGRPRKNTRRTTIGIPADLEAWLAWRTSDEGLSAYLWGLVRADRELALADEATRAAYEAGAPLVAEATDEAAPADQKRQAVALLGR